MIQTCPKCGAYYADDALAFCLADGCPLKRLDPGSDDWTKGTRAINEKARSVRRLKLIRWSVASALLVLLSTMVVYGTFTIETTPPVVVTYQISGQVTNATKPLSGVRIGLDGASSASTVTGEDGAYTFTGLLPGGNYTVTAVPPSSLSFSQPTIAINALSENALANFQVLPPVVYTISGRVLDDTHGVADVEIKLGGAKSASTTTDPQGNYSFTNLSAGSYTVTAIPRSEMVFTQPVVNVAGLEKDIAIDFEVSHSHDDKTGS